MAIVVVVDTSVFVAALKSAGGAARQVLRVCLQKQITPIIGHKLFLEFEDILNRPTLAVQATIAWRPGTMLPA